MKFLKTRNPKEAMLEALQFAKQVKENNIPEKVEKGKNSKPEIPNSKPVLLSHLSARYIAFLKGDATLFPEVMLRQRSKAHINDVKWVIKQFAICLTKYGYNFNELKPEDIGIQDINLFYKYLLEERKLSNRTFNKSMTLLSGFYKFLYKVEGVKVENIFGTIPHKALNTEEKINVPSQKQVEEIMEKMKDKIMGRVKVGKEHKDLYREWMPDLVKLAAYTGRRNEELVQMKFSDIKCDNNGNLYIKSPDIKVNRIRNLSGDKMKFVSVPVTSELYDLLLKLGYEKHIDSDRFLIANDEKMKRESMKHFISRSFSHYARQIKPEQPITLKSLRKLYITQLSKFLGAEQARQITGHSSTRIMQTNYIDSKVLAAAAKDFKVFDKNENNTQQREDDLQKMREQKMNDKQLSIAR
ncbi:MAG: tyrosine-type recombinase/integrase [Bacteroidetes bacterium]|nr:tyrosine-type recombinase/integrase [Bacteroidota bacterium]